MKFFSTFIPPSLYEKTLLTGEDFILPSKKVDFSDRNVTVFTDFIPNTDQLKLSACNILVIQEPNQLFGLHDWAITNHRAFNLILTWGDSILSKCPNSMMFPFGTSFIWDNKRTYQNISIKEKKFETSFLCGVKNAIEGHRLRHSIFNSRSSVTTPNSWIFQCEPQDKVVCWKSMFHIAVENSRNKNYFTEKVIDSFLTKTVPIYWGCPNLSDFFNPDGYITFNDENELIQIVNGLTEEDYHKRSQAIEDNCRRALYWGDYFYRLSEILENLNLPKL